MGKWLAKTNLGQVERGYSFTGTYAYLYSFVKTPEEKPAKQKKDIIIDRLSVAIEDIAISYGKFQNWQTQEFQSLIFDFIRSSLATVLSPLGLAAVLPSTIIGIPISTVATAVTLSTVAALVVTQYMSAAVIYYYTLDATAYQDANHYSKEMLKSFQFVIPLLGASFGTQLARQWYGFFGDLLSTTFLFTTAGLMFYFPALKDLLIGTSSVTTVAVSNGLNWIANAQGSPTYIGNNKSNLESKFKEEQRILQELLYEIKKDINKNMADRARTEYKLLSEQGISAEKSQERLETLALGMASLTLNNDNVNRKLTASFEKSKLALIAAVGQQLNKNGTGNSNTMIMPAPSQYDDDDPNIEDLGHLPASLNQPPRYQPDADKLLETSAGARPGTGAIRNIVHRVPHALSGESTLNIEVKKTDEEEVESEGF